MKLSGGLFLVAVVSMLSFSQRASAELKDSQTLQDLFEISYYEDYTPLACSDNVRRLYQRMNQPAESYILHIFHKGVPYLSIKPQKQRLIYKDKTYRKSEWVFHAVLLRNGSVYDLDYTNEPHPEPFYTYMDTMWVYKDLKVKYRFQIKKASDYTIHDTDGDMWGEETYNWKELQDHLESKALLGDRLQNFLIL